MNIRLIAHLALVPAVFTAAAATAGEPDYKATRITDRVHVVYGSMDLPNAANRGFRNNAVIVTTSAGVVLFDPGGSAAAGERIVEAARSLSPKPVVAVFNSHAHGDHWLGNEGVRRHFPDVAIYAHPTAKARIEGADGERWLTTIERATEGTAGGETVVAPNRTVSDGELISIGDRNFRIHYPGRAHTDNDIMIEVVEENVLFTGDVARNGLLGIMEEDSSFSGNIRAIDAIAKRDFATYIPGHGRAGGREMLVAYRGYLAALRDTVKRLYGDGLSDFEMKPAVLSAVAAYRDWSGFEMRLGPHISRAFLEIEQEAF